MSVLTSLSKVAVPYSPGILRFGRSRGRFRLESVRYALQEGRVPAAATTKGLFTPRENQ